MLQIPKYNHLMPRFQQSIWEPHYLRLLIDRDSSEHNWRLDLGINTATIIADNNHKFELHFNRSFTHLSCSCKKFVSEGLNWCQHLSALRRYSFTSPKDFFALKHAENPDFLFYNSQEETLFLPAKKREISKHGIAKVKSPHTAAIANLPFTKNTFGFIPETLNPFPAIQFYPYQNKACEHMMKYKRTILSLEMGWGKTLCALACSKNILDLNPETKILIVCPKSLKSQWANEISQHLNLTSQVLKNKNQAFDNSTFTIMNYEMLRDFPSDLKYDILILDEVQKIKNKATKSWKAIAKIKSEYCWALSGTVVENNVEDFLAIADILRPDLFEARWKFYNKFCELEGRFIRSFKNSYELNEMLETILYRAPDSESPITLDMTFTKTKVKMTPKQKKLHDNYYHEVRRLLAMSMSRSLTFYEKIMLSAYQTKTRLAADSIRLVQPGSTDPTNKVEAIANLVSTIEGKIVIFSEWKEFLSILEAKFYSMGLKSVRFDGSLSQKKRKEAIATFVSNPQVKLFLSTDAGGIGVDGLQYVSNTIIHCQMSWNPARLEQRNGRLFRIGQKNPVQSYLFLSEGSIEESIVVTHERKTEIKNVIFGGS